jgi:nitric oxide synthase oxygenase domain/subunit
MDKFSKGAYESDMELVKRTIDETKKQMRNLQKHEWVSRLSYEQWFEFRNGNIEVFSPLNVEDIRNSREFNYYFGKGEIVKLDVEVMNDIENEKYSDLIGLHAVVTDSYTDLHSFAHGSSYSHHVRFENGYETKPCGCAFPDMVPTWLLIPISDAESELYIKQYKNTEDKETLWFYIK